MDYFCFLVCSEKVDVAEITFRKNQKIVPEFRRGIPFPISFNAGSNNKTHFVVTSHYEQESL